jgi:eukaryotic-like serine/threonine-protein kinase
MYRDRLNRVSELYNDALARPAHERAAFLREACGDDDALRSDVESLLAQASENEFLREPAIAVAARMVSASETPVLSGRRVGVYEIQGLIGAGGMGDVYRAKDTRLGRDVALKILPEAFTRNRDRLNRFEREARTLAALNHPNIASIYGVEESDGIRALVLELVEGETLAERLVRQPEGIPIADILAAASQIVDALECAHDKGIVHRDLKPSNIAFTLAGTVKVLDFGLAKLTTEADSDAASSSDPPITCINSTSAGLLVGTVAYMSPEQARAQRVDKRTDIWAFGCVLYEMLTAFAPFSGSTLQETLAAILENEPDWSALPAQTGPAIRRLLRRCLEKDQRRRLHDIADARLDIQENETGAVNELPERRRQRWVWAIGIAGLLIVFTVWQVLAPRLMLPESNREWGRNVVTFAIESPPGTEISAFHFAISPDGRNLTWVAAGKGGVRRLWVRPLDSQTARELPGTEDASYPFWSPDSRSIGFIARGSVKRLDLAAGSVQTVAKTAAATQGAAWGSNNTIVFPTRVALYAVSATGSGEPRLMAEVDRTRQEDSLRFPHFLPDGRNFVYVARSGRRENSSAYIANVDGEQPQRLFPVASKVEYAAGHLLFTQNGSLMARAFDPATRRVGEAFRVADQVGHDMRGLAGYFTVSNDVVAYRQFSDPGSVLRWFDRSGKPLEILGAPRQYSRFRIAPDGRRVATAFPDERTGSPSIWILDKGQVLQRLTLAGVHEWQPIWSPEGDRIVFGSNRNGPQNLYIKAATGSGRDEPLVLANEVVSAESWSRGDFLAYFLNRTTTRRDLLVRRIAGGIENRDFTTIAASEADEHTARFSPDEAWIAYVSDETGRPEVYVQPFPPTSERWQISVNGAVEPNWGPAGDELIYLGLDGKLTAVAVDTTASIFRVTSSNTLFETLASNDPDNNRYDVAPDGKRFLIKVPVPASPSEPIVVLVNWAEQLKAQATGTQP